MGFDGGAVEYFAQVKHWLEINVGIRNIDYKLTHVVDAEEFTSRSGVVFLDKAMEVLFRLTFPLKNLE